MFVGIAIPVYVFGTIAPTPILSHLLCGTTVQVRGLWITASLNPPEYNGYKLITQLGYRDASARGSRDQRRKDEYAFVS